MQAAVSGKIWRTSRPMRGASGGGLRRVPPLFPKGSQLVHGHGVKPFAERPAAGVVPLDPAGHGQQHLLHAIRGVLPDRTYLLLIDPAESAKRLRGESDRIESEDDEFRVRVDDAYRQLADAFPQRIVTFDGARRPAEIAREILDELRQRS